MACCNSEEEAWFNIVKGAWDCCGAQIDPALEPNQCDSVPELIIKWGCIVQECACDIVDPEPCFPALQPIQPPPLLVAADAAGCLFSTIPYQAINLDQGGGVGVFDNLDGASNTFQFRAIASPQDTVSVTLNAPLIELETNPVETNVSANLPSVPSNVQTPVSIVVPTSGFYQINVSISTLDPVDIFEISAIGLNIVQAANYPAVGGSFKKVSVTYNAALANGPQNVANILQANPVLPNVSVDYTIQIVKIGP